MADVENKDKVQEEQAFETMADEAVRSGNAANVIQLPIDQQNLNHLTAQLFQVGIANFNLALNSSIRLMHLAELRTLDHWDKVNVVADTAVGSVADAMINQAPPDEINPAAKEE